MKSLLCLLVFSVCVVALWSGCGTPDARLTPKELLLQRQGNGEGGFIALSETSVERMEDAEEKRVLFARSLINAAASYCVDGRIEEWVSGVEENLMQERSSMDEFFASIRRNLDPSRDSLFYYEYAIPGSATGSETGWLVVRDGLVRFKFVEAGDLGISFR